VTIRDAHLVDFREAMERKRWDVTEAKLLGDPAPPKCKELARSLRISKDKIDGMLYKSVRHPPDGVCLALFLEQSAVVVRFERVSEKEWKEFVRIIAKEKE
jgi:hypothetical protein